MLGNGKTTSLVVLAALVVLSASLSPIHAAERGPTISASGHAVKRARPDRARVVVTIETRAARADRASQVNATHSQTVLKRLEALVGNRGTVFTRSYRIKPEYAQEEKDGRRRQILVGYIATNTLEAVTGNIGAVGSVLDAAVDAGAQRVGSVEFFIAEPAPLRLEALEEAGRKAHAEAEAIAGSLDVELGELLEASTQPTAVPGPRPLQLRAATKVATPLVAGDIEIHADVSVVYSVK